MSISDFTREKKNGGICGFCINTIHLYPLYDKNVPLNVPFLWRAGIPENAYYTRLSKGLAYYMRLSKGLAYYMRLSKGLAYYMRLSKGLAYYIRLSKGLAYYMRLSKGLTSV